MFKSVALTAVVAAWAMVLAVPAWAKHGPRNCYDYAWESQDMKDCMANPDKMRHPSKGHHRGMKHEDMKDMKGMKHDKDMKKS